MSSLLTTYSKFYYGYVVDSSNYVLNFDEGGPELIANLNAGEYTFTDFATEIERALNDAGALTYTVTANRSTRTITVAATGVFDLLVTSGTSAGISPFLLMGFTGADRTGLATYTGNTTSGSEYKPQFKLQSYISSDNWQQAADASINKTASGRVEVVKFGIEKFVQFQIKYITEIEQDCGGPIKNDPAALDNIQSFLQYCVTRAALEFMPDENTTATFQDIILDSSQSSQNGTGYKLKELYDKDLPGYFETDVLKFRLRE